MQLRFAIALAFALGLVEYPTVTDAQASTPVISEHVLAQPPLWLAEHGEVRIWLLGAINALPKGVEWLEGPTKVAVEQADEVVLEVWPSDPKAVSEFFARERPMVSKDGLASEIPEDEIQEIRSLLSELKLPQTALDRYKPWYAAVTLGALCSTKWKLDFNNGVPEVIRRAAESRGISISGLETPVDQLRRFPALKSDQQSSMLKDMIQDCRKDTVGQVLSSWLKGDEESLATFLRQEASYTPSVVNYRSPLWVERIEARMRGRKGSMLVVTSMGNLVGRESVQELAALRGIEFRRVR